MNQLFVAILSGLVFYFVLSFSTELSKKERFMLVFASLLFALIGYSLYTLLSLWLLILTLVVLIISGGALIYSYHKRNIERTRMEEVRDTIIEELDNKEKLEIDDVSVSEGSTVTEKEEEKSLHKVDLEIKEEEMQTVTKNIDANEEVAKQEGATSTTKDVVEQVESIEDTTEFVEDGVLDLSAVQDETLETIQEYDEAKEDHPIIQPEQDIQEEQEVAATEEIEIEQPEEELQQDLIEDNEQQRDELIVESQEQMEASEVFEEVSLPSEHQSIEEITEVESFIEETPEQLESESIEEGLEEVEIPDTLEIKPIDKQVLQLQIDQLVAYKPMLDQDEYESLLVQHISRPLHKQDYYIFATMLRDFYMETSQWNKLTLFLHEVKEELKDFPIILEEIQYVIEQYQDKK